ncbi:2-polyprenyl-6-methoxyphenol hydroxylase-like FAD-dependent oxidoreductase [Streptomyces sp. SAI-135]|uniref:FAD-dependent monooxygenase n=1 Tax=unclassified Streptomyces TaxID=2593676 RepID=UPI002475296E|nr:MULTISPECIES: FAD-dependent monooxygenase [unclassified Streptomyces]MDH6513766.1 2-polyprenyl-6-methoxyphenol hydroxylase-like FAD-dependent oxidoreductase [Streptomyces sp. SAI-090]MDH6545939.1 2-polyprenyl-6-methoxyphenol hydroxylase-like FAD-dependent oxidoreductase [Streptomyces sp. SAI-041]MDH6622154.1 2-polyprenyl-6-methoxyphenol hydroxylase-like FAD-dependent oxidoreductase [Streptomyces sp. SAI-135]
MNKSHTLIVGAGISGLALAKALLDRGMTVEVVERRAAEGQALGTGLYLPANAVRTLHGIGVGDQVAKRAEPVTWQRLQDQRGRPLAEFEVSRIWGEVGRCLAITRGDLHEVLRTAVDGTVVRHNTEVRSVSDDGTVTFAGGASGTYDLVVGADGINSAVRRSLFGGPEPRFLGQLCWRFIADDTAAIPAITDWTARLGGKGRTFLTVRLNGGRVYCYADINSPVPTPPAGDWRALFADFGGPVPRLLEQGANAHFAALHESENTVWTRPRAVLVGDAAHAFSPSMAQGGAMALEDALVLADTLATGPDVPTALAAFQARRASRVAWVVSQNHRRDKARNLPTPLRNFTIRRAGERLFKANHAPLHALP